MCTCPVRILQQAIMPKEHAQACLNFHMTEGCAHKSHTWSVHCACSKLCMAYAIYPYTAGDIHVRHEAHTHLGTVTTGSN